MGDVDVAVIAQRLISLRKHLGERQNDNLTIRDIAEKSGIQEYKMTRLEHGKGSWESLITVLLFYRSQGYNLDWILFPNNENIPLLISSGNDLLVISELIKNFSARLEEDYSEINKHLKKLGYSPLEDKHFKSSETEVPMTFDLS
jgi:transcriptional regulator with XRE-family HTH domain